MGPGTLRRRCAGRAVWPALLVVASLARTDVAAAGEASGHSVLAFGSCGSVQVSLLGEHGTLSGPSAEHVFVRPDGRLLVIGEGAMLRLMPDGVVDVSFWRNGGAVFSWDQHTTTIHAAVVQPDGRIVVAGSEMGINGIPVGALFARTYPMARSIRASAMGAAPCS